jgi:hypothetical protein
MSFIRCRCLDAVKKFDNERTVDSDIEIPTFNTMILRFFEVLRNYAIRALRVESKAVVVSAMCVSPVVAVAFRIQVCFGQCHASLSW